MYEYVLWDNDAVANFPLKNIVTYNNVDEYCGKADILRYEILHKYGGVYIDADIVILKGDKLHKIISDFDYDCGFGYETTDKVLANSVILAQKESKFLEVCIDRMVESPASKYACIRTGPGYITVLYNMYKDEIKIKIYDKTVFYPVSWHGIQGINMHNKVNIPEESVMFQYGYSTNLLANIINNNLTLNKRFYRMRMFKNICL
jgi:mannosyltransferase OCH1-like enzyme